MDTRAKNKRSYHAKWSLVVATCVAVAILLLPLVTGGCDSGAVKTVVTGANSSSATWTGNGSDNIDGCETGLHWILTPAGPGSLQSATLYVDFGSGYVSYAGYQPGGQGNGAFHFDSAAGAVSAAYADYTYDGDIKTDKVVLTISHCNDDATTTTVGEVTTTVGEVTTTTAAEQTTTTAVGGLTSTTAAQQTTTTAAQQTTTTAVGGLTSTTAAQQTTTTAVGGLTSTTVVGNLTTAGRIDTGGGGTAGGPNVMLWLIVSLLGALSVALGGSAIWSGFKKNGVR